MRSSLSQFRGWFPDRKTIRGLILLVAGIGTLGASILAASRLGISVDQVSGPLILAAVLVLAPLSVALNAAEVRAMTVCAGGELSSLTRYRAVQLSVMANAANLLPVPAGVMLRAAAVRRAGAPLWKSTAVQFISAVSWIGASVLLAGISALFSRQSAIGIVLFTLGFTLMSIGVIIAAYLESNSCLSRLKPALWLAAVEIMTAFRAAMHLWVVLRALGVGSSIPQAFALGMALPLAASVGFVPGGIGIAEGIGAGLAPIFGLPAAAGLLAISVTRLTVITVTVPLAIGFGLLSVAESKTKTL